MMVQLRERESEMGTAAGREIDPSPGGAHGTADEATDVGDARSAGTRTGRGITRDELMAVVGRAAELHAAATDAAERVSEQEVLRIGQELGLPATHVRQALFELPAKRQTTFLDRAFGPDRVLCYRVVHEPARTTLDRIETYLATEEYLRIRRRLVFGASFSSADDPMSRLFRAVKRPARRFHLSRARQVDLSVRPIESGRSHVAITMDVRDRRRRAIGAGAMTGGLLAAGAATGAALSIPVTGSMAGAGLMAVAAAAVGIFSLGVAAGVATAGVRFRRRCEAARTEVEGLLDRLQRRRRLSPPAAPWRLRLKRQLRRLFTVAG